MLFIYIHLVSLLFVFGAIVYADQTALKWFRGKKETLPRANLKRLHTLVWIGLIGMIVSGAFMAWPLQAYLLSSVAFWVKMFFVAVLIVNAFFIGTFMKVAIEKSFRELTAKERVPLFLSGGASALGWVGAFVSALFMTTSQWLLYFFNQILNFFV